MDHTVSLLYLRTALSFFALVYSILIIAQTRRILQRPWAFVYIFIRVLLALVLRAGMVLEVPMDIHLPDVIKALAAALDLITIREIHRAYKELFPETQIR